MKKFYRSLGGKIFLFLLCLLCIAGAGLSGIGAAVLMDSGYPVYSQSEEEVYNAAVSENLETEKKLLLLNPPELDTKKPAAVLAASSNVIWEIRNDKEKLLASSGNSEEAEHWMKTWTETVDGKTCIVRMSLKEGLPENDEFRTLKYKVHMACTFRYWIYIIAAVSIILGFVSYILLLCGSGWSDEENRPVPGFGERVPWDLLVFLWLTGDAIIFSLFLDGGSSKAILIPFGMLTLIFVGGGFIGLSMSLASRLKQKSLMKYSLMSICWRGIRWTFRGPWKLLKKFLSICGEVFRNLSVVWKTCLILSVVSLVELIALSADAGHPGQLLFLWVIEKVILIPVILLITQNLRKLENGARALASGDLSYHTETEKMLPAAAEAGENLNRIGEGMSRAVEARLKSERMKTELITNVSHDIKTPLTSVINYAALIHGEAGENEKVREYSEVLVRQSERLKRLLEDLVEASKAATGNLDVNLIPCSAAVFLEQTAGEYEARLRQTGLTLVQRLPEKELFIRADGRRMWRLFSNLMNNICKYSLAGSRVYLSLEEENGRAVFVFKNTSREPLNLSEEELFERFSRGDSSRHTEGSGLGLAIAKSMAELQGGNLRLITDGDLFKAEASFPILH